MQRRLVERRPVADRVDGVDLTTMDYAALSHRIVPVRQKSTGVRKTEQQIAEIYLKNVLRLLLALLHAMRQHVLVL